MNVLSPHVSYSQEGLLEISNTIDSTPISNTLFTELELIDLQHGYSVAESEGIATLAVDIQKAVITNKTDEADHKNSARLVRTIGLFAGIVVDNGDDRVLGLDYIHERTLHMTVFPQFQRWLNADGLNEESARNCIDAMALPFGRHEQNRAKKKFTFKQAGREAGAGEDGMTFSVVSRPDTFRVMDETLRMQDPTKTEAQVDWNWLNISTIGSCACFGVDGMDRESVHIYQPSQRLYEMVSHNIDSSVQSLSLLLGAATLTGYAADYPGREDILADATWVG